MAEVTKEVEQDKLIANNMAQMDAMRKNIEELMASKIARLTNWKLINVLDFTLILKNEYGADLSKIEE